MKKERLDQLLVSRGLFHSRSAARAAILAGGVEVEGQPVSKPALRIAPGANLTARPAHPYVSRGGLKLAHALEVFAIAVEGRDSLDIGASTGGFSDVLLRRGARHVTAVDVGQGQLHASLCDHPRLKVFERLDARDLEAGHLTSPPSLIVCDASFIALEKLLPTPLALAALEADFVGLFKPQFQVGRAYIRKGGLVKDLQAIERAMDAFKTWARQAGWIDMGWTESPIAGGDGNREWVFHLKRSLPHSRRECEQAFKNLGRG